jgi:hypothetical protein
MGRSSFRLGLWQEREPAIAFADPKGTAQEVGLLISSSENSVNAKFSLPHRPSPERYLMYAGL